MLPTTGEILSDIVGIYQVPQFRIAGLAEPRARGREAALFVTPERLRNAQALLLAPLN